jgi:hypothetical protein
MFMGQGLGPTKLDPFQHMPLHLIAAIDAYSRSHGSAYPVKFQKCTNSKTNFKNILCFKRAIQNTLYLQDILCVCTLGPFYKTALNVVYF